MADETENNKEQQELDELTVLQETENRDLSAEEQAGIEDVERVIPEQSDMAGTVLADSGIEKDAFATEIPVDDSQPSDIEAETRDQRGYTPRVSDDLASAQEDREIFQEVEFEDISPVADGEDIRLVSPSHEQGEGGSEVDDLNVSVSDSIESDTTDSVQNEPEIAPAPEPVDDISEPIVEPEPTPEPDPVDDITEPIVEPEPTPEPEPELETEVVSEEEPVVAPEPEGETETESDGGEKPGNRWGQVEEGPDQGKAGGQKSTDTDSDTTDDAADSGGGNGNQWGRVEDGPDQGKGGDQDSTESDMDSADSTDKGGSKGNMGVGNGQDEAPPGVTEDQPHYDERVEGADGDDSLETDFFLMDSEGEDSGGSWTDITDSDGDQSSSSFGDDNSWTESVESDSGKGKGKGKDKGDDQNDEDSSDGADNLDAFENEAEDFSDQADW